MNFNEICRFKDIEQVLKWFNEDELNWLRRLGFELKKITSIGECQILVIK